ncbi:MAG: FAD-dependent oxidoreductase, partial [Actinobacteria bacterium]|nr:FAD-dependent oxidoreductase [Actinomycetota bacterium]
IFEQLPVAGGMLAVGIPEYRLPRKLLQYEIDIIKKMGVEIKLNTRVGKDIKIDDLKKEFNAIFIAAGAHKGLKLEINGEDNINVIDAVDFLRKINMGDVVDIGEKVVVVGGGNAAIDAVRTAYRLGKKVQLLYRRTVNEMPAQKEEIEDTIAEGIDIQFLTAPVKINSDNGVLKSLECVRMELGAIDKSGRRKPVPIKNSEFNIELDTLITAIGQKPEGDVFIDKKGPGITKWSTIEVDIETLCTCVDGLFAGGDIVNGPKTVTESIAQGKLAARMIYKYINGEELKREYKITTPAVDVDALELTEDEIEKLERFKIPKLVVSERTNNFKEVDLGFSRNQAVAEAKNCLRCDKEEKE